ncbi:hypothetical protein ACG83_10905 [Frankia sp. R43]|uniref:hypothetical protein n=1 Tax=Frankia sp. R43 TaxID=269536 RepID=UPI0006CA5C8E|nr:hypothetical protein [Frankia sp. R43]KPM55774.1 hypothetical protein ACG83_10905 [Frankia sp. R43]
MTDDPIRGRIAELIYESADDHGVVEPSAEQMGGALNAVLDHLDTYAAQTARDGDPIAVVGDLRNLLIERLEVENVPDHNGPNWGVR